jgi:hypothetical protein
MEPGPGEFHWRDGWFFKRLPDGSVRVQHRAPDAGPSVDLLIPSNEWASIVASMSAEGETAESYQDALANQFAAPVREVRHVPRWRSNPRGFVVIDNGVLRDTPSPLHAERSVYRMGGHRAAMVEVPLYISYRLGPPKDYPPPVDYDD